MNKAKEKHTDQQGLKESNWHHMEAGRIPGSIDQKTRVIRKGKKLKIGIKKLVPGDLDPDLIEKSII